MYILDFFKKSKQSCLLTDKEMICKEITDLEEKLENIRSCFEIAVDDDIIEALIYEENGVMSRLSQVRKKARDRKISANFFERDYLQQFSL